MTYEDNSYLNSDSQPFILVENSISEGPSGLNQSWDFSNLKPTGKISNFMLEARALPVSIYYPEANIVVNENDCNYFFRVTPEGMDEYGTSCDSYILIYDQPIKKFPFPFRYGESISGTFSGHLLEKPENTINGTYSTEADGYGTLILPGNIVINDVLRVKFTRYRAKTNTAYITYRWYNRSADPITRYPLLSITKYLKGGKESITKAAYYALCAELTDTPTVNSNQFPNMELSTSEQLKYQISVSPNPFSDKALINFTLPQASKVTVEAFDNLGRRIALLIDENLPEGIHSLTFKNQELFIYFIRFTINSKVICSKKLIHLNQ